MRYTKSAWATLSILPIVFLAPIAHAAEHINTNNGDDFCFAGIIFSDGKILEARDPRFHWEDWTKETKNLKEQNPKMCTTAEDYDGPQWAIDVHHPAPSQYS